MLGTIQNLSDCNYLMSKNNVVAHCICKVYFTICCWQWLNMISCSVKILLFLVIPTNLTSQQRSSILMRMCKTSGLNGHQFFCIIFFCVKRIQFVTLKVTNWLLSTKKINNEKKLMTYFEKVSQATSEHQSVRFFSTLILMTHCLVFACNKILDANRMAHHNRA